MANATKYVANGTGNNANTGDSFAQAYADIPTAIAALTGDNNTVIVCDQNQYLITSAIVITAALKGTQTAGCNRLLGATAGGVVDGVARPEISTATDAVPLFTLNDNDFWEFQHLDLTNTAGNPAVLMNFITSTSNGVRFNNVRFAGGLSVTSQTGSSNVTGAVFRGCEITGMTDANGAFRWGAAGAPVHLIGCHVHDNAGVGIGTTTSGTVTMFIEKCLVVDNGGSGASFASTISGNSYLISDSVFARNAGYGVDFNNVGGGNSPSVTNCIFYGNTAGHGLRFSTSAPTSVRLLNFSNNAFGGNSLGDHTGLSAFALWDLITLAGDPFVDAANGDYRLNDTAGAGALCRAAGLPALMPGSLVMVGNRDLGPLQNVPESSAALVTPAEAAGRPSTLEGMMRRVFEKLCNKKTRNRATGVVTLFGADGVTALESQTQSSATVGSVTTDQETQGA